MKSEPDVKKNIASQATKIIHDIAHAYELGHFDDPVASNMYCQLLACICEGKVKGVISEDTGQVKWALTDEFSKEVETLMAAAQSENVIRGPW